MLHSRFNGSHVAAGLFGAVSSLLLAHVLPACMASQDKPHKDSVSRSSEEEEEGKDEDAAEEESIEMSKVPETIRAAAQKYFSDLQSCKASRESEHGAPIFEIVGKGGDGRSLSLNISSNGSVFELEREMPTESLPAEVRATLTQSYGDATVGKAEAVEVHYFEVHLAKNGKKFEVKLSTTGQVMEKEKKD